MPHDKPEYEDIANTPAHKLMKLSLEELHAFETVARNTEEEARAIQQWIAGIRVEKSIRAREKDEGTVKGEGLSFRSSLSGLLGPTPLSEEELLRLRRRAWQEHGLLIVELLNHRLTPSETRTLNNIGTRLYEEGDSE